MPELNNPQLKAFCNNVLRPFSNNLVKVYQELAFDLAEYEAKNLGTIINNGGAGELITDGSETDGRTRVVGGDVYNFVTLLGDLKTFIEASGRIDVIAKWKTPS